MKRLLSFVLALVMISALSACDGQRDDDVPNLETIPTREEIVEYCSGDISEEHIASYMSQVVYLVSRDEAQQEISDAFAKWIGEYPDITIQGYELGYRQTMNVNLSQNQKFLRQYVLSVDIYLNNDELEKLTGDRLDDVISACDEAMMKDTVSFYRLAAIELEFYAVGSDSLYNSRDRIYVPEYYGTNYDKISGMVDWQLPGEYQAQTIAYDFAKKLDEEYYGPDFPRLANYPAAGLKEIGTEDGSVYIKIYLDGPEDTEDLESRLDGWAKELYSELTADEKSAEYLKTYGGDRVVIIFGAYGQFEF